MEWVVSVDAAGTARDESYLEELLEELLSHSAAVSGGESGCSVTLSLEADNAPDAALHGAQYVEKALANIGVVDWIVNEIRAMTDARADMHLAEPSIPDLAGVSEIADMLVVSRQRASELARSEQFPKPIAELRSGPVWTVPSLQNFIATWQRRPGRPAVSVSR